MKLLAQRTGTVSKIYVKQGDTLDSGADILEIDILDSCWIEASIPDGEAYRVYPGQIVRYEWNGHRMEGTVEEITDVVTESEDKESISEKHVRISFHQEGISNDEMKGNLILHFSY